MKPRNLPRLGLVVALALAAAPAASQVRPTAPLTRATVATRGGVDWAAAVGGLRQSQGQGPQAATGLGLDQATVDRTRLPILLPVAPGFDTARIYSFGDYYAISADISGAGWALTGTTARVSLPVTAPLRTQVGPEDLVVQRTIDGQLASFVRYGVLYTVELRCDEPTDARCRDDALVRQLVARSTSVVMGKAARQAAGLGG